MGRKRKRHHGRAARDPSKGSPAGPTKKPATSVEPQVEVDAVFWRQVLRALETEPRGLQKLKGASGYEHKLIDLGVDHVRDRLVLITDSPDPKVAAFVQSDIQQLYSTKKVITARTLLVSIDSGIQNLADNSLLSALKLGQIKNMKEKMTDEQVQALVLPVLAGLLGDPKLTANNPSGYLLQLVSQIGNLNWSQAGTFNEEMSVGPMLGSLTASGGVDLDGQFGICPIPVCDMTADEVERVKASQSSDMARELLQRHDVLEYFFPRSDSLALGLIDRGIVERAQIENGIALAAAHGHPLADSGNIKLDDVVSKLQSQGYVVEGELGFDTTVQGKTARAKVKFKPKESLVVKVKNMVPAAAFVAKLFFGI